MFNKLKGWHTFIILTLVYITLSISVNYTRYLNLKEITQIHSADYRIYCLLSAIVAGGASPYSTHTFFYRTDGIIPRMYCHYAGSSSFNALIINLTTMSPKIVVYVIVPFLSNIILIISLFIVGKILRLKPEQTALLLFLGYFVNDGNAVWSIAYGTGETIGNSFMIIGVAYYLKERYYYSIIPLVLASVLHLANLGVIAIITICLVLQLLISFVSEKRFIFPKRQILSLGAIFLMVSLYLYPIFVVTECYCVIPYTDVGEKVINPFINPPPYPNNDSKPNGPLSPDKIFTIIAHPSKHIFARIGYSEWLRPTTVFQFLSTFTYPVLYIYWGTSARGTLEKIMNFVGYNLTETDVEALTNLQVTSLLPILVAVLYNIGTPLLFVSVIQECYRSKDKNKTILFLGAYLLITVLTFVFLIFRTATFPERFIRYTALFWSLILVYFNSTFLKHKVFFGLFIFRSILWISALCVAGGL